MPLQQTSGNVTADAYGGGVATVINYIEDVFSTYLYTGNGSTQTITNNIDLSTKGGMVWTKSRSNAQNNWVFDTVRGPNSPLGTNITDSVTDAYATYFSPATNIVLATTTGYSIGTGTGGLNTNNFTYVGWTFRKQPKFFDVVTYTGNGTAGRTVAHNLGSVPGCIIVKSTSGGGTNWDVYHRSLGPTKVLELNLTDAENSGTSFWNDTAPTASVFTVGSRASNNTNGETYVAYLFAHNAGGFGLTGADNVISCGSLTTSSYYATVNLGYEPQFVLTKRIDSSTDGGWYIADTMRGLTANANATFANLFADTSAAESQNGNLQLTSTGFVFGGAATGTYIYIAIRRGPMKVPTDATKVFAMATAVSTKPAFVSNAVVDMGFNTAVNAGSLFFNESRLAGPEYLNTRSTAAATSETSRTWDYMNGMIDNQSTNTNNVGWMFGRAPSFFDEVCYTVSGFSANNVAHNLTVTPELFITKPRGSTGGWSVYGSVLGATTNYMTLNANNALQTSGVAVWAATSTTFSDISTVANGTFVCYLFATLAGISKVGSYTGNGTTQTINCGFTAGARFVLIKRTDATGDWYVYDTLRGMTTLTDPYVLVNSAAAQTATLGSVTTVSTGFALNSTILAAINVNTGSYIFLAIA
jgi:hypothetical protein